MLGSRGHITGHTRKPPRSPLLGEGSFSGFNLSLNLVVYPDYSTLDMGKEKEQGPRQGPRASVARLSRITDSQSPLPSVNQLIGS